MSTVVLFFAVMLVSLCASVIAVLADY